eukprot:Rmarinus@m.13781
MKWTSLWLLCLALAVVSIPCLADEDNHKYKDKDPVTVFLNVVGPYHNPQETYFYYALPFCRPSHREMRPRKHMSGLGEVLEGNKLRDSGIDIFFKENTDTTVLCEIPTLSESASKRFLSSIKDHYWYQMYVDELPMWGMVGEIVTFPDGRKPQHNIFTHRKFEFSYNNNRIIQANLTNENPVPLEPGMKLTFTYSVTWKPTSTTFTQRFNRYLDYDFFEHRIHIFSIFNSFMMVVFLAGLVSLILMRTLKKDYARYSKEYEDFESLERAVGDDSGWKQVHSDVFRPPPHLGLLCAFIGTGTQMAALVLVVVLVAMTETLYIERGTIVTVIVVCYTVLSVISGYFSGSIYARSDGQHWIRTLFLTSSLFPGVCCALGALLHSVAAWNHTISIPFGTIVVLGSMWACVSVPLTTVGTIIGRNWAGESQNPCRVSTIPRPIPSNRWFIRPFFVILVAGLLPFGSVFIETYFIFAALWNYKFYYVYGFMLAVFVIVMIVTICTTIVVTYFLLNAEDYRWPWTSFLCGASTALYIFLYSIFYYHVKTRMSGFYQTVFYFGYMAMFSFAVACLCGSAGYMGASIFVRRIYRNIKSD